jgi:hypothetical protein
MAVVPPPVKGVVDKRSLLILVTIFALLGIVLMRLVYIQVFKADEIVRRAGPTAGTSVSYASDTLPAKPSPAKTDRPIVIRAASRVWNGLKHLLRGRRNPTIRAVSHGHPPRESNDLYSTSLIECL